MARQIRPNMVTNNIIRGALDLQRGGEHKVEVPPHTILKDYFGLYSVSGNAHRTYKGPNKFSGEIARILMEYVFAHTNPTRMPQKRSSIIIKAYQGGESSPVKKSERLWGPSNVVSLFYPCWHNTSRCYTHPPRLPLVTPPPLQHHHQKGNDRGPWP